MSTSNVNNNNKSSKKNIRFEHDLIEQIEQAKDPLIPFAAWVKQACRDKLNGDKVQVITSTVKPVRPSGTVSNPRYTWITPQGEFVNRTMAVEASGIKADSLTKMCDNPEITDYSRILLNK